MRSHHSRRFRPLLGLLLAAAAACGAGRDAASSTPTDPTTPPGGLASAPSTMSAVARAYLDEVVQVMQANHISRRRIDWTSFRVHVMNAAPTAQIISSTYPAIREALRTLGDGHSSYTGTDGGVIYVPTHSCRAAPIGAPQIPADIGYVRVGSFTGDGAAARAFTDGIQQDIRAADHDGIVGWIVDLRGNGGGNMWPMLAGLAPILGDGLVGHFADIDSTFHPWEIRNGASWSDGVAVVRATTPYRLRHESPRVAVLTDSLVASSGEATAIAFRGRPDTRAFGTATCGLSTANRLFTLSDGAGLNLTVSTMADRERTVYGESVMPDEVVSDPAATVQRAIAWLRGP